MGTVIGVIAIRERVGIKVAVATVATAVTVVNIMEEGRRDQRREDEVSLSKKASGQLAEMT